MSIQGIPRRQYLSELTSIFKQAAGGNPGKLQTAAEAETGADLSPIDGVTRRSQLLDYMRQVLPHELGGYTDEYKQKHIRQKRQYGDNETIRFETLEVGDYPTVERLKDPARYGERTRKGEIGRRAAQAAGALFGDLSSQGLQNIWWFLNAPQAVSMVGTQAAMHGRMKDIPHAPGGSPLHDGNLRVAAAMPGILGVSAAAGSLLRLPGYTAAVPSEEDKTQSANIVSELFARGFMGRGGQLLSWDEFSKERPDVTRGEYEAYKAYLHGNKAVLKGTMEGIHGPEVNFMGKSIPVATGLLPLAAGLVGAGIGTRMAGRRLAHRMGENQFQVLGQLKDDYRAMARNRESIRQKMEELAKENKSISPDQVARLEELNQRIPELARNHYAQYNKVRGEILKDSIIGSTIGMGVTGAGAHLLQTLARAADAKKNQEVDALAEALYDQDVGLGTTSSAKTDKEKAERRKQIEQSSEEALQQYNPFIV